MNGVSADFQSHFEEQSPHLEDFWGRRENTPRYERTFALFGRPARLTSNHPIALTALDHSLPLFTSAPATPHPLLTIQFVVRESPQPSRTPPENLSAIARYTGDGEWLSIQLGAWGHCHIETIKGTAIAILEPALAERPDLISRHLLNTIFTNLLFGCGFAMMHCTGLIRNDKILLLMAPHNTGKSTTALRLVLAGYQLLSDSQIYVSPDTEAIELLGFPVGKAKLRRDMVPEFPALQSLLTTEQVRDEVKFTLDLRKLDPALVYDQPFRPTDIELCLLSRANTAQTLLMPASSEEVMTAAIHNSIFYDTPAGWERTLALIERCLNHSHWHHLVIGRDPNSILRTVNRLMGV
jgi:hypothetical protein